MVIGPSRFFIGFRNRFLSLSIFFLIALYILQLMSLRHKRRGGGVLVFHILVTLGPEVIRLHGRTKLAMTQRYPLPGRCLCQLCPFSHVRHIQHAYFSRPPSSDLRVVLFPLATCHKLLESHAKQARILPKMRKFLRSIKVITENYLSHTRGNWQARTRQSPGG